MILPSYVFLQRFFLDCFLDLFLPLISAIPAIRCKFLLGRIQGTHSFPSILQAGKAGKSLLVA